ncbi:nucleotide-binding protein [[Eubacterium] cellulosolvens]
MKVVIASGKGGTGKSMIASSLSILFSNLKNVVACDCDVDAPNLGLWLGVTKYDSTEKVAISEKASINLNKCTECGKCLDSCRFGAIEKKKNFFVNQLTCEGCGVCQLVCQADAIELRPITNAEIMIKKTDWGFKLISGQVYPGASGSGKIVQKLRKKAELFNHDLMILDSAAGIGCPVIASITGCDYAVLVTEPTPSSFTDLRRIIEIVDHFRMPYGVVINKWDIYPKLSEEIEKWSGKSLLGKVSYDKAVINSIVNLRPVITSKSKVAKEIEAVFETLKSNIGA